MSDVVAELRKLADEPAYDNLGPTLKQLAEDIDSGRHNPWRKVDLMSFFDADTVLGEDQRSTRLAHYIELIRNILLFLPLLITWGGIYAAVRAYQALLNAPAAAQAEFTNASFLQMWTRGFGNRTWVTLDVVALSDFVAILVVIVFFVAGTWLERRGADDDERARQRNVKGLRIVLTEASLMLNAEEQDVTDRLINGAHAVLPKYQEALASLTTAHAQMTGLVATGRANIDELVKATGSLADTGKAILASAASLASPTTALARHAEQIKDVTGKFAVGVTQISTNLPSVRDGLAEVLASVRDLNRQLHELAASQAEGLRAETAARTAAIGQLASTQHDLARSIDAGRTNVAELVQATGALANGGTAMATNAIELKANVGALVTSTEKLDSVVGSLVSGTREMNAQLPVTHQGTLDLLGAIRDLAKLMQDIYVRQEVVAQELGVLADNPLATAQAAKRTADLAKQTETALANTVNALPVQMDKLRAAVVATLEQEIQERKAAARSVGKSVESFSGAAVDVVNSLRSAIEELRRAPEYVLPDLRRAGVELAQVLQQGQALVQALTRSAEAARQAVPGRRPRLWGWWRRDDRVGR